MPSHLWRCLWAQLSSAPLEQQSLLTHARHLLLWHSRLPFQAEAYQVRVRSAVAALENVASARPTWCDVAMPWIS